MVKITRIAKLCPENKMFLSKDHFKLFCLLINWYLSKFKFCHHLRTFFFVTIWVFQFCHKSLVISWGIEFCQNLSFVTIWVLSLVTFWFFEFCHSLVGFFKSQFEFLSFITSWVLAFEFYHNEFLSFIIIWFF